MSLGCKFYQLQILLNSVNTWPSNHKNKKSELFWDTVYIACEWTQMDDSDIKRYLNVWVASVQTSPKASDVYLHYS